LLEKQGFASAGVILPGRLFKDGHKDPSLQSQSDPRAMNRAGFASFRNRRLPSGTANPGGAAAAGQIQVFTNNRYFPRKNVICPGIRRFLPELC
jgi:hypothetical protein